MQNAGHVPNGGPAQHGVDHTTNRTAPIPEVVEETLHWGYFLRDAQELEQAMKEAERAKQEAEAKVQQLSARKKDMTRHLAGRFQQLQKDRPDVASAISTPQIQNMARWLVSGQSTAPLAVTGYQYPGGHGQLELAHSATINQSQERAAQAHFQSGTSQHPAYADPRIRNVSAQSQQGQTLHQPQPLQNARTRAEASAHIHNPAPVTAYSQAHHRLPGEGSSGHADPSVSRPQQPVHQRPEVGQFSRRPGPQEASGSAQGAVSTKSMAQHAQELNSQAFRRVMEEHARQAAVNNVREVGPATIPLPPSRPATAPTAPITSASLPLSHFHERNQTQPDQWNTIQLAQPPAGKVGASTSGAAIERTQSWSNQGSTRSLPVTQLTLSGATRAHSPPAGPAPNIAAHRLTPSVPGPSTSTPIVVRPSDTPIDTAPLSYQSVFRLGPTAPVPPPPPPSAVRRVSRRTPADANLKTLAQDVLRALGPPSEPLKINPNLTALAAVISASSTKRPAEASPDRGSATQAQAGPSNKKPRTAEAPAPSRSAPPPLVTPPAAPAVELRPNLAASFVNPPPLQHHAGVPSRPTTMPSAVTASSSSPSVIQPPIQRRRLDHEVITISSSPAPSPAPPSNVSLPALQIPSSPGLHPPSSTSSDRSADLPAPTPQRPAATSFSAVSRHMTSVLATRTPQQVPSTSAVQTPRWSAPAPPAAPAPAPSTPQQRSSRQVLVNRAYIDVPPAPVWVREYKRWKSRRKRHDNATADGDSDDEVDDMLEEEEGAGLANSSIGVQRTLVDSSRRRVHMLPCRWHDCDAILNCIDHLTQHAALHAIHQSQAPEIEPPRYACLWSEPACEHAVADLDDLVKHVVETHTSVPLYCDFDDCQHVAFRVGDHITHINKHMNMGTKLREYRVCKKKLITDDPLPPTPTVVPIYGDRALVIYPAYVPPEQREALAQVTLPKIDGRKLTKAPSRSRRRQTIARGSGTATPEPHEYDQASFHPDDFARQLRISSSRTFGDTRSLEITDMFRTGAFWVGDGWTTAEEAQALGLTGATALDITVPDAAASASVRPPPQAAPDAIPSDPSIAEDAYVDVENDGDSDPLGPLGWRNGVMI